eukprot:TRINITY_DN8722_c0_g1_i1.p1 TRINITY_DN8722_c0_g1~~TRINITY_DN8722_c0_g1_i1.p1  ORF type:complete len:461 (+),score=94.77 TRINITY_DN8722_c0_g1_i1:42-1385(+)
MIGDYQLLKRIGSGGSCVVYKAQRMIAASTFVAVKLPDPKKMEDPDQIKTILEGEVKRLKMLNHPNIVKLLDDSIDPAGFPILFMELYDDHLQNFVRKTDPQGRAIPTPSDFISLLNGLAYMNSQKIAHRDIKCQNILVRSIGPTITAIVWGDLGVSKELEPYERATTLIGAKMIRAPEMDTGSYDPRLSDLWSFGCTILEMLSPNFKPSESLEFPTVWNDTPYLQLLKRFCERTLIPEPKKRRSISKMINDLTHLNKEMNNPSSIRLTKSPMLQRSPSPEPRNKSWWESVSNVSHRKMAEEKAREIKLQRALQDYQPHQIEPILAKRYYLFDETLIFTSLDASAKGYEGEWKMRIIALNKVAPLPKKVAPNTVTQSFQGAHPVVVYPTILLGPWLLQWNDHSLCFAHLYDPVMFADDDVQEFEHPSRNEPIIEDEKHRVIHSTSIT